MIPVNSVIFGDDMLNQCRFLMTTKVNDNNFRDCNGIYIGETGRAYKTRLAEHKKDLKPANLAKVDDNNFNKKNGIG